MSDALTLATETQGALDTVWLLVCGILVFFMQAGFAMLEAGSIRRKNVKSVLLKNIIDACSGAIGFYLFGYAIAYGTDSNEFMGGEFFALGQDFEAKGGSYAYFFFQWAFAATASTIVGGSVAERTSFEAYLLYSFFLTSWVYPVVVHWVWDVKGWISAFNGDGTGEPVFNHVGMIDFAGSGVVHMVGGLSGLLGAVIVGPRRGRFENGVVKDMPGHNAALASLGTFILWFGWYGFNPGSTLAVSGGFDFVAAKAAVTTTIAAAMAGLTTLFIARFLSKEKEWNLTLVLNGVLGGLVAITANCAVVEPYAALIIGMIAAFVYYGSSQLILRLQIDDPIDAAPVHFFCGLWGLIATGLFATKAGTQAAYGQRNRVGLFYDDDNDGTLFANQIVGALAIIAWVILNMGLFFLLLKKAGILRIPESEEESGMDFSKHGGHAYPEEMMGKDGGVQLQTVMPQYVAAPDSQGKRIFYDQFGNEHRM